MVRPACRVCMGWYCSDARGVKFSLAARRILRQLGGGKRIAISGTASDAGRYGDRAYTGSCHLPRATNSPWVIICDAMVKFGRSL